jgi:hypothetical protein
MNPLRFSAFVLFATIAFASPLPVPPACGSGTLATYLTLTNGCTIGPQPTFTFSNFAFAATVLQGSPAVLTAGEINVAPSNPASNSLNLVFSSSGFQVGTGQSVQYVISYNIDPPPPEILHFAADIDPAPTSGLAQVTTDLCVNGFFTGGVCPTGLTDTLNVFISASGDVLTDSVNFSGTIAKLGVVDTITLRGGSAPSDPASFSSFGNDTFTSVPEPVSGFVAAWGLALSAFLARCLKTKIR